MKAVDRRTFLREVAAASAVTAVSAMAPGVIEAGAARSVPLEPAVVWNKAPCRLCGVGCGLLVGIENRRAVAVKGDPESPVGKGLACAKGYYSVQALYGRDRITRARIRRDAGFNDVPMGEALDTVAKRIQETIRTHGKDSVAIFGSAQWTIPDAYVASKLFKGAIGTNNVESSSRLYAGSASAGLESTFGLDGSIGCYDDIENADVFILWDINLAETDPVLFSRILERKRIDPAVRIIDLATRTTRTSYAADRSLLYAPHSTLAVANAICSEIVSREWVDRAFVDRHVAFRRGRTNPGYGTAGALPITDDATAVSWKDYVSFLSSATPERAQQLSGMRAENVRWLASLYGDPSRKVMSIWGANANQHARGTWTNNALYNIHLLVGKIASPGNSAFCVTGQPGGGCAVHDAGTLTHTLPRGLVTSEPDRRRAAAIWGVPVQTIPGQPTHTATSMFRALARGDIRFLWIQATNPMLSYPQLSRYRRRGGRDAPFIVVSEAYPTPTTDVADVVLPAAMWLEREGIYANAERRLQHFGEMTAPPGDAMSDAWQMIEVARRLGFGTLFPYGRDSHVEQIWDEYRRFHDDSRSALPPLAALRDRPGVIWPTVSGHETRWRYNREHDPAATRAHGKFDFYGHDDGRAWIWLRPSEAPAESPTPDYPFWLTTGPVLEQWGGGAMTQRIPTLHRAVPRGYLEINRDDAGRIGVRDGEPVRVVSARGTLDIAVRIDYRSQPPHGVLFAPSFDESLPVKQLMLDASCPLSAQPDAVSCAVRIERLHPRAQT